jgi:DNA-binding NarL/FixJ family response regulator
MFKKVLISDDLESISKGLLTVSTKLGINHVEQVQYCDDAFIKIRRAVFDNEPYDLLITDLSFLTDYREQTYKSGEDLIIALSQENSDLKIIIYSVESRLQKVRYFMNKLNVNAYVSKGRQGLLELEKAILAVSKNENYISANLEHAFHPRTNLEIDDYDITLVKLLSNGLSQEEISKQLKKENISPSSLSSIEKRLNKLRIQFKANNAIHLIATVKDLGLI